MYALKNWGDFVLVIINSWFGTKPMPISTAFRYKKKLYKVEGAKTNTPFKTNTYKRLPIANTLHPWTVPDGVRVSGPTEWRF